MRRGVTPKYDLVQIEGQVHEPTFKYRGKLKYERMLNFKWLIRNLSVTVGEFVATGCGQSKKKAKHSAAK